MATSIGKNQLIKSDVSLLYDYMATESHVKKHREQYKVFDRFMNEVIRKYGIEVNGKSILDVSGGNGNFIKEFEQLGASVAMSEFNQKSVDFAIKEFGLDARRFDFNTDDISAKFDKRFNVVMMRYAIMFCNDFNRFMDQMELITQPDTTFIINGSMAPSMGAFLRSQYDDYTYLVLYSKDKVVDIMSRHGYKLTGAHEETGKNKESYSHDMHASVRRLDWWLYRVPAIFKGVPNDPAIHSHVLVFKKQQ
jgi:ubiquinone/menaquinone biosynthesis C-methylase UbiE